jgi:hypothetical protein
MGVRDLNPTPLSTGQGRQGEFSNGGHSLRLAPYQGGGFRKGMDRTEA